MLLSVCAYNSWFDTVRASYGQKNSSSSQEMALPASNHSFKKKSIATKNLTRGWPKHQSSPTGLLKSAGWRNGKKKKRVWTPSRTSWKNQKCIYYRLQHRQNPQKTTTWRWAQLKIDAKISKWTLEWTHQGDQKRAGHKNEDSTVLFQNELFGQMTSSLAFLHVDHDLDVVPSNISPVFACNRSDQDLLQ